MKEAAGTIVSEMLWAKFNTDFAHKVQDKVIERNPKGQMPWEWDPNETILYYHFEEDIKAGISTYCALRRVLKTIATDELIESLEKEIKENADKLSDDKLVKFGWVKE